MDLATVVLIAVALAMDAFAVAVASGLSIRRLRVNHALRIAGMFGLFQGAMPLAGWLAGRSTQRFVSAVDHWLVFALLAGIGGKMIYESRRLDDRQGFDPLSMSFLLLLSVATSIDALAVGVSYGLLDVAVATPAIVIGVVTFALSLAGVYLGDHVGHLFEHRVEAIGGVILIAIGLRILVEHIL